MKTLALLLMACVAPASARLDIPLVKQHKNGCGAAAVVMVMRYWVASESPTAREVHDELYRGDLQGIRLSGMRAYLERRGFRAFTFKADPSDLERHMSRGRPLIVGLKAHSASAYHFAVLVGIEGGDVWLNDPGRSKPHCLKRSKFEKMWAAADRWLLLATP